MAGNSVEIRREGVTAAGRGDGGGGIAVVVVIVVFEGYFEARNVTFDTSVTGFVALVSDGEHEDDSKNANNGDDN